MLRQKLIIPSQQYINVKRMQKSRFWEKSLITTKFQVVIILNIYDEEILVTFLSLFLFIFSLLHNDKIKMLLGKKVWILFEHFLIM